MNYMNDDKERIEDKIDSEWSKIYTVGDSRVDNYDVAWIMSNSVIMLIYKDILIHPDGTYTFRGAPIYIINNTKDEEIIKLVVEL